MLGKKLKKRICPNLDWICHNFVRNSAKWFRFRTRGKYFAFHKFLMRLANLLRNSKSLTFAMRRGETCRICGEPNLPIMDRKAPAVGR